MLLRGRGAKKQATKKGKKEARNLVRILSDSGSLRNESGTETIEHRYEKDVRVPDVRFHKK